ncbi:MAG: hypothetical protein ACI8QT_001372 [Halioglobus sp.]|jgi:hypothetical protein
MNQTLNLQQDLTTAVTEIEGQGLTVSGETV